MRTNDMFSECCDGDGEGATCGATAMFPQFTIYDSMKLDGISFKFYMNATCGLAGQPPCDSVGPEIDTSPVRPARPAHAGARGAPLRIAAAALGWEPTRPTGRSTRRTPR
jgi:hypothetical protein